MVKSEIRLRYSGFIVFASKLLSVATGIAFVLMITRTVSEAEFGIWGNVNDVFSYFTLLATVLPFWTTRFVAREHGGSARTGVVANIFISIASASIYLTVLPTILSALQIGTAYKILYTIISIEILELYTTYALEAVLVAKQPQTIGYGLLIYEVCKVALGFTLIIQLKLGLLGAIYSMISSYIIQIVFYIKLTAKELKESVNWTYLKEWLKASPINIYNIVGNRIAAFTLIFLFMYGELARSYYGAAVTIASIVTYSTFLAYALYPRLLSESNTKDVSTSLKMVLMVAIPMATGAMVLSDSYLTILGLVYREATPVLLLLAINALCTSLSQVFSAVVAGTEGLDVKAKIPFRELTKSRIFQIFTLPYIQSAIALPTTFFVLFYIAKTQLEAATYLALISVILGLAMLLCNYIIARKCLTFEFPWKNVTKYIVASAVMAAPLLIIPHPTRLLLTLGFTVLGGIIYFAILATIDHDARELIESVLNEAKSKLHITQSIPAHR
jgi:O-antigen/teichoic acid export membrane protein